MTDETLIRQVAQEVMGYHYIYSDHHGQVVDIVDRQGESVGYFLPLTNANHWMIVVERMRELGYLFRCGNVVFPGQENEPDTIEYFAEFYKKGSMIKSPIDWPEVNNSQLGNAICMAALKAVRHV